MDESTALIIQFQKLMTYYVQIISLCAMRWAGVFFIFPIFVWAKLPPLYTLVWSVTLALPALPGMAAFLFESNLSIWPLNSRELDMGLSILEKKQMTLLSVKEFMLGVILCLFPSAFFFGIMIVGEVLDQARGDLGARSNDGGELPMTNCALVLFMTGAGLFITSGEFITFIHLIYKSYEIWPVDELSGFLTLQKMYYFVVLSMSLVYQSLKIGIPFLVVMWSLDLVSMFQAKLDKKFQAQDYVPAIKNFIFLLFFIFYLKISDIERYNPTLAITSNFSAILEAGDTNGGR